MPLNWKKNYFWNERNSLKYPNWWQADQLVIYTSIHDRLQRNNSLMVTAGLEPATSGSVRPCCLREKRRTKKALKVDCAARKQKTIWNSSGKQKKAFCFGRFVCRWSSGVSRQSKIRKIQKGITISLRHRVNRQINKNPPNLTQSTWFQYRSNYCHYHSVKGFSVVKKIET